MLQNRAALRHTTITKSLERIDHPGLGMVGSRGDGGEDVDEAL
jgi:hypothetical protein